MSNKTFSVYVTVAVAISYVTNGCIIIESFDTRTQLVALTLTQASTSEPVTNETIEYALDSPAVRDSHNLTTDDFLDEFGGDTPPTNSTGATTLILNPIIRGCGIFSCSTDPNGYLGDAFLFRITAQDVTEVFVLDLVAGASVSGATFTLTIEDVTFQSRTDEETMTP